ncbi:MAG TPA: hypothetical protein ENG45_00875 [Candidatus Aenigmarchaeota archaeon]|nr:hypothetical protein [Candidatus Aenigmarchaeota archaeon]
MKIREVIVHNPVNEFKSIARLPPGFLDKPDFTLADKQFKQFIRTLAEEGVKVYSLARGLTTKPHLYKVRDSAFVYNNSALVSSFSESYRKGEEIVVKNALKRVGVKLKAQVFMPGTFEACNAIFVSNKKVLVGVGKRVNEHGFKKLVETFPNLEFIKVKTDLRLIHHINILDETIVMDEELYYTNIHETLKDMDFDDFLIVSKKDVMNSVVEFIQINNKVVNVVSDFNKKLRMRGYDVITLDLSELVKGNAGCASMVLPLKFNL